VRDCDTAQAVELIRALRQQLHEMTTRLARMERQGAADGNERARATWLKAAALRIDITEAQVHIDRLQRRYLNGNGSPIRDSLPSSSSGFPRRW
jgi:hypothetical protein